MNDKQLVLLLRNNEVGAFDKLFYRYSDKVFCFAYSLLKNKEDSREIVQESFLRIWEKRENIDPSKSFKSFLFKISYNLIIDQLRSRLKDREFHDYLERYYELSTVEFNSENDFEILQKKINKAVKELPRKRKSIYRLSRQDGFSHKEIADQLNISVKTVENQINLALKHIKRCLGKEVLPVLLFLLLFV